MVDRCAKKCSSTKSKQGKIESCMATREFAFEARGVKKHFDDVKALDGVSLRAESGKIFGLLGPNGAGKTTLVNMLSTLSLPTAGTLHVHGINVAEDPQGVREVIGLAGQYAAVDEFQTGYENLYMVGRLYHLPKSEAKARAKKILADLRLEKAANRPVRTYSGGMRRRLDLGASLVGRPKILFLDEPTTGLDPSTRLDLWHIIRELVADGTTILLTTQYMEEADELADYIVVLNFGKVIAEGTAGQLKAQMGGDIVQFSVGAHEQIESAVKAVSGLAKNKPIVDEAAFEISVPVHDGSKGLLSIIEKLSNIDITPQNISLHRPSLDDVFLTLTGEKTKERAKTKKRSNK